MLYVPLVVQTSSLLESGPAGPGGGRGVGPEAVHAAELAWTMQGEKNPMCHLLGHLEEAVARAGQARRCWELLPWRGGMGSLKLMGSRVKQT